MMRAQNSVARHLVEKQKLNNSRCKIWRIEETLSKFSQNCKVAKHVHVYLKYLDFLILNTFKILLFVLKSNQVKRLENMLLFFISEVKHLQKKFMKINWQPCNIVSARLPRWNYLWKFFSQNLTFSCLIFDKIIIKWNCAIIMHTRLTNIMNLRK